MDYQSAQQAYDQALSEYQSLMNKPQQQPLTQNMVANPYGMGSAAQWQAYNKNQGGLQDTGYLNDSRSRLDSARSALDAARQAQQGKLAGQQNRLTGQASNALYGGILGYNPAPMQGVGGQQFQVPQGNLQAPMGQMQGVLGGQPNPLMGGMGQMMQPRGF